jgi:hypothetical protein
MLNAMTIPDSVSSAVAFQQSKLASSVQTAVAAKTLNVARSEGANALSLLSSASNGAAASSAPANSAPSHGGSLDTTA